MAAPDDPTKDDRHQLRCTPRETELLDSLRARKGFSSRSETLRYCLQTVADNETDAIGSRRHFSRTMHTRMDTLEAKVEMNTEVMLLGLTELFSALLVLLNEGGETEATDPQQMRIDIMQKTVEKMPQLMSMLRTLEKNRRKQADRLKKKRQGS
jgi:hypothetical protein